MSSSAVTGGVPTPALSLHSYGALIPNRAVHIYDQITDVGRHIQANRGAGKHIHLCGRAFCACASVNMQHIFCKIKRDIGDIRVCICLLVCRSGTGIPYKTAESGSRFTVIFLIVMPAKLSDALVTIKRSAAALIGIVGIWLIYRISVGKLKVFKCSVIQRSYK